MLSKKNHICFRNKMYTCFILSTVLQIRASQWSITGNLQPLTAHIYHEMIIVTGDFFQEIFLLLLLFPKNSFERSWTLNSLNLITFTKHTEKVCFLLYLFIFYLLFCNHSLVLTLFIFCYFYTACKHTDESILFLLVVLQSLCILMLSNFCTFRIISSTKKKIKSFNLTSNTFCCKIQLISGCEEFISLYSYVRE